MPVKPVKFSCRRLLAACAVLSPTLAAVPTARAVDRSWDGTGPLLFWDTGSNWNPDGTPTGADAVTLDIDLAGNPIIAGVSSVARTANFRGFDYEVTGGAGGTLNAIFGTRINAGASVTASNGLDWTHTGGEVDGDLFVGGARSEPTDIGDGTLNVIDDSSVAANAVFIGQFLGTTGTVTVGGVGSGGVLSTAAMLDSTGGSGDDGFSIGVDGTGVLNVLGGGTVRILDTFGTIPDVELGINSGGNGTLNIGGGTVIAEDLFTDSGTAEINVFNGGLLDQRISTTPDAFLARSASGTAAVRVIDEGSAWNMNRLEIGESGSATVSIEEGGTLTNESTNDIVLGRNLSGSGRLAVAGTPEVDPRSGGGRGDPGDRSEETISVLNANRDLFVGNSGGGELRVGIDLDADLSTNPVGPGHADVNIARNLSLGVQTDNVSDNVAYITGPNTDVTVGDILYVGERADATMTVNGGATVTSRRPRVASGAGTTASLTVDGPGSRFDSTLDMTVGTSGDGTAVVSNAATLSTTDYLAVGFQGDSNSTLTVDGPGSVVNVATNNGADLYVGGFESATGGTGTVIIQNGGRINASTDAFLGGNAGGTGTVIVTGAGSIYNQGELNQGDDLFIGYRGAGSMQVLDGGSAFTEQTIIADGANTTGNLLVSGDGSQFRTTGRLAVGSSSTGTMTVADGAVVSVGTNANLNDVNTRRLIIGSGGGADGSKLTVTGPGSRVDFFGGDRISVGFNGGSATDRATLEILDGGVVDALQRDNAGQPTSTGFVMVADENGSNGLVTVDGVGSRLSARFMNVGDGPSNGNGLVNITNGGLVETSTQVEVGSNGNGVGVINIGGLDEQAQPFANVATLEVGTNLDIGSDDPTNGNASGTVNVLSNGVINADGVFVGRTTGAFGTLTVGGLNPDAPAVVNVANDLVVAGSATSSQQSGGGTFNLNANAVVNVGNYFRVRDRGIVNINGGEITFESLQLNNTSVAGEPTINFNSGTVRYDNAGTVNFDVLNSQVLLGETGLGSSGVATLVEGQTLAVESSDPAGAGEINFIVPLRLNGGTLRVDAFAGNDTSNLDWDAGSLEIVRSTVTVGTAGLLGRTVALNDQQALHVDRAVTVQANGTLSVTGDATTADTNEQFSAGSLGVFGLAVFTSTQVDADADDTGNALFNNGRIVLIDSDLTGDVANNASITLVGNSTINGGSFAATPASTLEVSLDPDQLGGALLSFTDSADLTGRLDLDTDATNFALLPYQSLTLLESADVSGSFSQVIGSTLASGEALAVTYTDTSVLVTRALRGDANLNGQVEQSDLNAVLSNWGSTGQSWATGDLDGDGLVAQGDLNAVLSNWGSSTAPDFRGFAVPEPTAALVLTALSVSALRRRTT